MKQISIYIKFVCKTGYLLQCVLLSLIQLIAIFLKKRNGLIHLTRWSPKSFDRNQSNPTQCRKGVPAAGGGSCNLRGPRAPSLTRAETQGNQWSREIEKSQLGWLSPPKSSWCSLIKVDVGGREDPGSGTKLETSPLLQPPPKYCTSPGTL